MWSLFWAFIFTAFSAAWFVTSGYLSYAWSDGDDRARGRFQGLFLVLYFIIIYAVFMW